MVVVKAFLAWSLLLCHYLSFSLLSLVKPAYKKHSIATLFAKKFEAADVVTVEVQKPLGLGLVENEENSNSGVCIDELDAGSLLSTGMVRKGMYLLTVNDIDVRYKDFDTILDLLVAIPDSQSIKLQFIESQKVFRGPAELKVVEPSGKVIRIDSLKGLNLRSVLQASGVEIYDMKGKLSNCGGGGSCGTCGVEIRDNEGWAPRPDFEGRRLRQYSEAARLSCNTVIEGDCTVYTMPKKMAAK